MGEFEEFAEALLDQISLRKFFQRLLKKLKISQDLQLNQDLELSFQI